MNVAMAGRFSWPSSITGGFVQPKTAEEARDLSRALNEEARRENQRKDDEHRAQIAAAGKTKHPPFARHVRNEADPPPNETPDVMVSEAIAELQQVNPLLATGNLDQVRQALGLLTEAEDEICDAVEATLQLIDTLEPGAEAAARATLKRHAAKASAPASAADVLRICTEGGCLELAQALVTDGATLEQVTAKVKTAKEAKAAEATRVSSITALGTEFHQPELAERFVAAGMTVADARATLAIVRAKVDRVEIDAGLSPDQGPAQIVAGWKNAFARLKRVGPGAAARH